MNLRTIAILRGEDPGRSAELAAQCWEIGMDLVEVPVQGEAGWASLERVSAGADGRAFGAGTVLSTDDVHQACSLGASVIVSPGIDAVVVKAALDAGASPLPGVMTPTEVGIAARLGLTTCKFFPATALRPEWLKAMHGPYPAMQFVAVGGVDASNAKDFVAMGARGLAFGSSIHGLLALQHPADLIAEIHELVGM
jgi:2-dehydro-3-deoxyphosphogluconate aldolase/(4S)-4-hydroxy-2-oxoglutarate aldolase